MPPIIKVENLSKCYTLRHQRQERFPTFRDAIADNARRLGRRLLHPFNNSTTQRLNDSTKEEFWALKDVSFDVKPGDRVGIIGRNGAGKSTLLKILSRITEPTTGRVSIKGRVASLLEVGTGFHPELSGRENIFLNGAILGMKRAEIQRKFDEIVAFAEVEKFLDTPVKRYSSGMYVRLAFAVAAHLESEILIVDEVLAVGDAQFQKKCLGKMEEISSRNGKTLMFVSHNMGIVKQLCGWGCVLETGGMSFAGPISAAVDWYLSRGMSASDFEINLTNHPRRLAGMKKLLKAINLVSGEGVPTTSFSQLDFMLICIEYDSGSIGSLAGAGFIVFSQEGVRVGGGNTYMSFMPPHRIPSKGKVVFTLPVRQFTPGCYSLTVSLGSHQGALEDKVENALSFTVLQADIYGTGYLLTKDDGVSSLIFETKIERF